MRVDIERDARTSMTELARRANRIDTCSDQVTRERVPEIVEPELGHTVAVEVRRLCSSVETALRDVVPVERSTRRGGEHVGVGAWQPGSIARWRGGDHGDTARVDRASAISLRPAFVLRSTRRGGLAFVPRLSWARTRITRSRKSMSPQVSPRISWIRIPLNTASASSGRYRDGQRSRSSRTSSAVSVRGSLWARPRGSSSRWSRNIGFSARYPRRAARSNTRRNGVMIPRIVHGASPDVRA